MDALSNVCVVIFLWCHLMQNNSFLFIVYICSSQRSLVVYSPQDHKSLTLLSNQREPWWPRHKAFFSNAEDLCSIAGSGKPLPLYLFWASLVAQLSKNLPAMRESWVPSLWSGGSPGGGLGNPLQHSCLENPHGQRSLAGYNPWGHKESDKTEQLRTVTKTTTTPSCGDLIYRCIITLWNYQQNQF